MTSNNINIPNMDTDFPCDECGKMLHFDMADDLEGDPSYYIPKYDGKGGELKLCKPCGDKLGYKDHYP